VIGCASDMFAARQKLLQRLALSNGTYRSRPGQRLFVFTDRYDLS